MDLVRLHPDLFEVKALAAGFNVDLLASQIREFRPAVVACANEAGAVALKHRLGDYPQGIWVGHSEEGLVAAATEAGVELVVAGLPGSTGLVPTFAAVNAGKDVALATKEVLVMAGGLFMETVARKGVRLLPVDSEQSAVFQAIEGHRQPIRRLLLTASGGPFRDMPAADMAMVARGAGIEPPPMEDGPQGDRRFGNAHEQGPGGD